MRRTLQTIGGAVLALVAPVKADNEILSIRPQGPPGDEGALIGVLLDPPADAAVEVQTATEVGAWENLVEIVPADGSPLNLSLPNTPADPVSFFRIVSRPNGFGLALEGDKIVFKPSGDVYAEDVAQALSRFTGRTLFLRQDETWPLEPLPPPGTVTGLVETLIETLGLPGWTPPPRTDDSDYAAGMKVPERPQVDPLPDQPGDNGTGVITNGWPGNTSKPVPLRVDEDPPPGQGTDKIFTPTIPDVPDGVIQEPDPTAATGSHVRVRVSIDTATWNVTPRAATRARSEALMPTNIPAPPVGGIVWVVRNVATSAPPTMAAAGSDIVFLGAKPDSLFEERSYDPPEGFEGGHGSGMVPEVALNLPVPLPRSGGLQDLLLEIYQYKSPGGFEELTPESFERNAQFFTLLGAVSGSQMDQLIGDPPPPPPPASLKIVHRSGPSASKFNLVIMGDGFADNPTDQALFDDVVYNTIMADFFSRDIHPEILNAINLWKIDLYSIASGVTEMDCDGTITFFRNSALEYRYTGDWSCCWAKGSTNTGALIDQVIAGLLPEADGAIVVLNVAGSGGCNKGDHFVMTRTRPWSTVAHEFGHFFGNLADEYFCTTPGDACKAYDGDEPSRVNQTKAVTRSQIKWKEWIPAWRPVPTADAQVADNVQDIGLFVGSTISVTKYYAGIYKPTVAARMDDNSPEHNPVGYTAVRNIAREWQEADMTRCTVGDFDGDGFSDAVLHDHWQISLHLARDRTLGPDDPILGAPPRSLTGVLEPTWFVTNRLTNDTGTVSWEFRTADKFYAGDFDADGLDDLYVVNLTSWNKPYLCMLKSLGDRFVPVRRYDLELPGWDDMREHDEFYVADFTGDGRKDLFVFNGLDWDVPYLIMLRSTGTSLVYVRRYDEYLTAVSMGPHEMFHVCNTDGDSREEVISHNRDDWSYGHIMVFRSDGTQLLRTDRWYGQFLVLGLPYWVLRENDVLHTGDFNGDGNSDLALFNGFDWSRDYLGLFAVNTNGIIQPRNRYDDVAFPLPGWQIRTRDRFHVANVDGDGDDDLVVYNHQNWNTQYLGMLKASGDINLHGTWQDNWVGGWNLGSSDQFFVSNFRGASGWDDLFVANAGWFGLLRSYSNQYALEAIYRKWIHNHRFHEYGFW
jgi:hypothetical protein